MKIKQIIAGFFIAFYLLFIYIKPVSAQTVFTDDFSNEYEKWQDVRNTFDLWSIVLEESKVFIDRRSTLAEIIPKDEYWDNSWKNYIYKLDYTYYQGADKALSFWFKDISNWYQFHFIGNNYILSHIKNGQEIWKQTGPLLLESGKKHFMELHLEDGNIKFIMDNILRFEYFDHTFDNDYGRIGLKAGAGNIYPTLVHFDNIEVNLISDLVDTILEVLPIKQTDPLWKDIEYDSATAWAQNSFGIGDWGCLLTSINMIMDFHQIKNMPDGTLITPKVLNSWLKNQEDGFIGGGLVNWSAVSRLIREINEVYGTTKLEYSRIAGSNFETAITEIQKQNPVILEIPGHFLVGNGIKNEESTPTENSNTIVSDLYITDPAYSYELFSQHQTNLVSTRLLTPSFTDLSYIHAAHKNNISAEFTNNQNQSLENHYSYAQNLSDSTNTESSPEFILHEIEKPETGTYFVKIYSNSQTPELYELTLFVYDNAGNLSNLSYEGIAGTQNNPTIIKVQFEKELESTSQTNINFSHLLTDIDDLKQSDDIYKHYVAYELQQLTESASKAINSDKIRYINALQTTINWYQNQLSENGKFILEQRLTEIKNSL